VGARVVVEHKSRPWKREKDGFEHENWFDGDWQRHFPMPPPPPKRYRDMEYRAPLNRAGQTARIAGCPCLDCSHSHASDQAHLRPTYSDYDDIDPFDPYFTGLSEHQYLLCASHMFGFVLKDRSYGNVTHTLLARCSGSSLLLDQLDVEGLTEPNISERAIDRLVMRPESNKDTIKAIVKTYTDRDDNRFRADFIHGKGEGQIILLHGPPGTGKIDSINLGCC
jgi:hypothetical protein